ncbi:MAG: phosphoenolpyruvate--protein phosphotransferase [Chromatiales bacterium]|jgi:phosphotransferase system enzyme I (PtsI)
MTFSCNGIGISTTHTIAIGKAHLLQRGPLQITPRWIGHEQIQAEIERLRQAVHEARLELHAIRDQLPPSTASDIVDFINTHLLMIEDATLTGVPEDIVREQACSAEWALQLRRNALVRVFDEMEDPYLRTRKDDLDHVVDRIQKRLLNYPDEANADDLQGKIIIARDLAPSDTILMRHQGVIAFITEFGGPMSHTAILARSLNIPAIVGVRYATSLFRHGETLVVDSANGVATGSPADRQLQQFRERLEQERGYDATLRELIRIPMLSTDGEVFKLMANIELVDDIDAALENGAAAVGLYRTEFLYMNRNDAPSEEEHVNAYREIIDTLAGLPVTIRTLDLGADKTCTSTQPSSSNPALGLRAIRLCLKETELFKTQLRAILRVSAFGPVSLMLPMLTNTGEVDQALALLEEAKQELRQQGIDYDVNIQVGGMIEVPAAALAARSFAEKLDFLSIGTNDLIQYTLAIDRVDDEVNYLYDPLHPALLKLIQNTIDAASQAGKPVTMCGEMAADSAYIRLLIGMGLREFSMQPNSLLKAKQSLLASNVHALRYKTSRLMADIDQLSEDELQTKIRQIIH